MKRELKKSDRERESYTGQASSKSRLIGRENIRGFFRVPRMRYLVKRINICIYVYILSKSRVYSRRVGYRIELNYNA